MKAQEYIVKAALYQSVNGLVDLLERANSDKELQIAEYDKIYNAIVSKLRGM